jgi:hypothetical protein
VNWPLIALASIGIFALLVLFLAACALGARADEAGENARRKLPDGAKGLRVGSFPVEPEHSHRSALAGRHPLHLFASDKPFHRGSIIGDD